jgi:hypothetical protein
MHTWPGSILIIFRTVRPQQRDPGSFECHGCGIGFCAQRTMNWTWDAALQCFTTTIEVEGTLVMTRVITRNSTSSGQEVTDTLNPSVNGSLTLRSKAYVGPGFSGRYNWSGDLLMVPNPFAVWNLSSSAVSTQAALPSSAAGSAPALLPSRRLQAAAQAAGSSIAALTDAEASRISSVSGSSGCSNAAGSSSAASCAAAHQPLAAHGSTAEHMPSSNNALLQASRSSSSIGSSSHLPVAGQVAVKEYSPVPSSDSSVIVIPASDDDHTIIVSGSYIPGLGVPETCWGSVNCPVEYNPQQGLPEVDPLASANASTGALAKEPVSIPTSIMQWIQMAGGLGGGLLLAALVVWLIVVFIKRAQQDEDEQQQQKRRAAAEAAWLQQQQQQGQAAAATAVDSSAKLQGNSSADELLHSARSTKSGQTSRRSTGQAVAAGSTSLVLSQQQQADAVQWLPGAAARVSVEDLPQLLLLHQQEAAEQEPSQPPQQQERQYKPFNGNRKLPAEAAAAAAVQAGNRPAVVSANWAMAGTAAGGVMHTSSVQGGWDMPTPADGTQSMSTAVNLHAAADGSADQAAAGRQQQRGLFGWLGQLLFGNQRQPAATAAAARGAPAARPFKADYLHVNANGSTRRARPGHAAAARSNGSSAVSPAFTAVIPFDDDAAAAEAAAASVAAGSGVTTAAGGSYVGRQSLRRRIKLSTSESSLKRLQSSNSRQQQQQSPGRPHSSSPVGDNGSTAAGFSPRRNGRWFDTSADAATAAAAASDGHAGLGNSSADVSGFEQQQQRLNRRSKAVDNATADESVAGEGAAVLPGDRVVGRSRRSELRLRAELQE